MNNITEHKQILKELWLLSIWSTYTLCFPLHTHLLAPKKKKQRKTWMLTYYVYLKLFVPRSYVSFFVLKALKNYNETTEERKLAFENLKAKDEKSSYEIETQMRKLQRIQVINNILSCHKNFLMLEYLHISTNYTLQNCHSSFRTTFLSLKVKWQQMLKNAMKGTDS